MQIRIQTPATRKELQVIILRKFGGSQAEFSRQCCLDSADTSRVLTAVRPATLELVSRATAALEDDDALALVNAFLSDILAQLPKRYAVAAQSPSTK